MVAPTRPTGMAVLLAIVSAFALHGAVQAQGVAVEYAVKATYLYKFAPFVEWPAPAFASGSSPFQICILGRDPFGESLDRAASGQRVGDRPVVVRRLKRVDAASGCHILYLGESSGQTAAEALRAVRGAPILTVADDDRGGGAIIKFVVKGNRVRFDIDTAAAAANHLSISSKLLRLATNAKMKGSRLWAPLYHALTS